MPDTNSHHPFRKFKRPAIRRNRRRMFAVTAAALSTIIFSAGYFLSTSASNQPQPKANPLVSSVHTLYQSMGLVSDDELGLNNESDQVIIDEGENGPSGTIEKKTVQRGDSIYSILNTAGLTPAEIHELTSQLKGDKAIRGFRAGKSYELETDKDGKFTRFTWQANPTTILHLTKNEQTGKLNVDRETIEIETRIATLEGTLHTSLAKELSSKNRSALTAQLSHILSSRINFRRDIRDGATYKILYQEQWLDGKFAGTGDILAVEINANGRKVNAYQFLSANGSSAYYDENGHALSQSRGLYIKPCHYSRISSPFGYRIHPITHRRQFHGGIDLAAPTGTPVRAVADGKIIYRGRKGLAGNLVAISHGHGVRTMYMHLSRFARSCRYGTRVKQGDIIGYVGATGRATGPHLDFRIIKNGHLKNPMVALRQKAPTRSLSKKELGGFMAKVQMYQEQLARTPVMVADASKQGENENL